MLHIIFIKFLLKKKKPWVFSIRRANAVGGGG